MSSGFGQMMKRMGYIAPWTKVSPITEKTRIFGRRESAKYFTVDLLRGWLEPGPVKLDDGREGSLRYTTPRFWVDATVFSRAEEETKGWKVGLVQALMGSTFEHKYERGMNGWDFPVLPVNDGLESELPWYGGSRGYAYGLRRANLSLNDHFDANVAWCLTVEGKGEDDTSRLLGVRREQRFHVWVAAYDTTGDAVWILDELAWAMKLRIAVDPHKPPGRRASVEEWNVSWAPPPKPLLPKAAWLGLPTANSSQRFRTWPAL
eukprot:EG_transcript_20626